MKIPEPTNADQIEEFHVHIEDACELVHDEIYETLSDLYELWLDVCGKLFINELDEAKEKVDKFQRE